ncbi:hypothetical protein BOTBODRAFT_178365 [Botryobasidium botryosum FD-172 SS1]|uniref:Uncharacterized protein n=1 Tax=Botryobasidium botryosum (strain FD-172 SS1) TaxID=930990 RepID=A0A067M634_BOTB1|nr:hypothetical protein BOTBODRAFT_178365 [Botryobasidium botryosum FD-172 SS1]
MTTSTATGIEGSLDSLKKVKNTIIGNPVAKLNLAQEGSVHLIIEWINAVVEGEDPRLVERVRIEAAHVISSLSYRSPLALNYLLADGAHQALLHALQRLQPSDSDALKCALARAFKYVAVAIADTVGPPLWGLGPQRIEGEAMNEARRVLEEIFYPEALDIYLPLLADSSTQSSIIIASLIASALRYSPHRKAVTEWLPPADRVKETKGKRGWERVELIRTDPSSPSREGGWVARHLMVMIRGRNVRAQEAALGALAAITKDNGLLASILLRHIDDVEPGPIHTLVTLSKSRMIEIRLASALCLPQHMMAASSAPDFSLTLLGVLNNIIDATKESRNARMRACFTLSTLVTDDKDLQDTAYSCGTLTRLHTLLMETTPHDETEWPEDEPEDSCRLREGVFTAIATSTLHSDPVRRALLNMTPPVLSAVARSTTHIDAGVRYAACQCARTLSRSVQVLRTSIGDSGLAMSLFGLMKEEKDMRVLNIAVMGITNMVNNFAPTRAILIQSGALKKLVELIKPHDDPMRLNATWALRNALYRSSSEEKRLITAELGWDRFSSLLADAVQAVREQAMSCLRNIATSDQDIQLLIDGLGSEKLSEVLESSIEAEDEESVTQALHALSNLVSVGTPFQRELILSRVTILKALGVCLTHSSTNVRKAASNCVAQLASKEQQLQALRDVGIEDILHVMASGTGAGATGGPGIGMGARKEEDQDTRDSVRRALELLESGMRER